MELREFAEQVLFSATLEEKLRCPEVITDERPGTPLAAPETPGRPRELQFKSRDSTPSEFPGVHRLEQERERGRLLHFFANHELLATELMALVLLRFPDAPAAFRRGVLQTLRDEQAHTRLYLDRMRECGIRFGEIPVSGYFWRSVSTMENPLDYVASLSLTFEQANLDFCRQFADAFNRAGDLPTAKLLERIHHDEIGHVASGLKWFRRWKNPRQSDWEAFCQQLKFPLSPRRARGPTLNVEGRRAAGLDPQFIAELNVFSQSKGRTPAVFWFNPFAEGYLAMGRAFTPTKHQAQLADDLANLPQFLAREDDVVIVRNRPAVEFLSGLKQSGFALPEFVELDKSAAGPRDHESLPRSRRGNEADESPERPQPSTSPPRRLPIEQLAQRRLGSLRPWAWGPDSVKLLGPLFQSVTGEERAATQWFNEGIAQLYSKSWSAAFLDRWLESRAPESWLCTRREVGVTVASVKEALAAIAAIRGRGHQRVLVKQALGLAGANAIRLWEPELLPAQRRWIGNHLENGRALVIEPWLERVMDFSVQLEMTSGGLRLRGYTGLINDRKGQFQANWAAPGYDRRIPSSVTACFPKPEDIPARLQRLYSDLTASLEAELTRMNHLGPVGIDAFVYRTANGEARLKPVVEINPRYTMGRVTVELMKRVCPGSFGLFRIVNRAALRSEGVSDFPSYAGRLRKRFPLQLEGEPVPRIRSGAICLSDPARANVCLATFQVARELSTLLSIR